MPENHQELISILKNIELFKEFDNETINLLASNMTEVLYKKGDLIYTKGDPGLQLYVILEGSVSIHNNGHIFNTFSKNQYFGEYSFIDKSPHSTNATAIKSSRLMVLSNDVFCKTIEGKPDLWGKMMIPMISRLKVCNEMEEHLTRKADDIEKAQAQLLIEKQELEKQKIELEQKNEAKDKFFTIISHDLKNPFSAIINITDLMLSDLYHPEPVKDHEYIKQINFYSHKIFGLLENLLQWARTQTGQIKISYKKIQVGFIVNNIMELQSGVATQKNIAIVPNIDPNLYAFVDHDMATFVFRNIVSNALKFSPNNSTITITAKEIENDMIEISISDQGMGMDESHVSNLFRIDSRSLTYNENNELEGTGLGLILCKEFVEKNNGKIWAKSIKGVGSTFYFTIPKAL